MKASGRDRTPAASGGAIVFTGEGRAFCDGGDRHDHVHPESEEQARDLVEGIQRATRAISFGAKPVVGVIHGSMDPETMRLLKAF